MNEDFKNILIKILETINYSEDKDEFVAEFLKNIQLESLLDLINTLPSNKQEDIKNQLSKSSDNQKKVAEILEIYFLQDQIQQSLENVSKNAVIKYIQTISQTLSDSQRANLIEVLESFSSHSPTNY